jgi:predicted nucleic acid-binding protein
MATRKLLPLNSVPKRRGAQPNAVVLSHGRRHWKIFMRLCREAEARGNLIPDAYLAALAIESSSEWITSDRDFTRFRELRWSPPPT